MCVCGDEGLRRAEVCFVLVLLGGSGSKNIFIKKYTRMCSLIHFNPGAITRFILCDGSLLELSVQRSFFLETGWKHVVKRCPFYDSSSVKTRLLARVCKVFTGLFLTNENTLVLCSDRQGKWKK